jgi:hypothetical protein
MMLDEKLKQDRLIEEKRKARDRKRKMRALQVKRDQANARVAKELELNAQKLRDIGDQME